MKANTSLPSASSLIGAFATLLLVSLSGCDRDRPSEGVNERSEAAEKREPTVENIADNPSYFVGKRVVVSGEVDDLHGDRAFELEEGDDLIFKEKVLVLTKSPIRMGGASAADDDDVIVSGQVRLLEIVEIERDLGWDLTPEIESRYRTKPVLVADSIRRVTETARWSEKDQDGTLVGLMSVTGARDPEKLDGRRIELDAVPVRSASGKGFWAGYGRSNQVFVKAPEGFKAAEGDLVDVQGTLRKMPSAKDLTNDLGIDAKVSNEAELGAVYLDAREVTRSSRQTQRAAQGDAAPAQRGAGPSPAARPGETDGDDVDPGVAR